MPSTALVVMSRRPAPGRCKSRLSKDIGPFRAAAIQSRLINHTLAVVKTLEDNYLIDTRLSIAGAGHRAAIKWADLYGIKKITFQGQGNLGTLMRKEILKVQAQNLPLQKKGQATIVIGTDLPTLCRRDLIEGIKALKTYDLVIGPTTDGGYWLIGLSEKLVAPVCTWPFSGIPWGTDQVLTNTLQKAIHKQASVKLLQEHNDLDIIEDFDPWYM